MIAARSIFTLVKPALAATSTTPAPTMPLQKIILSPYRAYWNWRTPAYVFVHINKTAGTSITKALDIPFGHYTAQDKIFQLGRAGWDRRESFAVVRNPWDKVVSHYHYRLITGVTGLKDNPVSFPDWVRLVYRDRDPRFLNKPKFFMPQVDWMKSAEGEMAVKTVMRFESLSADFNAFCQRLGLDAQLPHVKQSKRVDFRTYYDDDSAALIAQAFAPDLEAFGYRFDP